MSEYTQYIIMILYTGIQSKEETKSTETCNGSAKTRCTEKWRHGQHSTISGSTTAD